MHKIEIHTIKEIINRIDQQLTEPLNLDKLAAQAGISKYHFHRLFKSITGKSLMAYVRGRKLSMSIVDLMNTDLKMIDIAAKYRFEQEQSYIRAFRQKFGITPAQCRKRRGEIEIEQKIDSNFLEIGAGLLILPRMCICPAFYVQGIREEIVHAVNLREKTANKLMEKYRDRYLPMMKNVINPNLYIGLVQYSSNHEYSNYYMPCTPVTSLADAFPPLEGFAIPMGEYAVFRYVGFHSPFEISYAALKDLYDYVDQWLADTSYVQPAAFHFERVDLAICSNNYCEMDLYFPIVSL